MEFREITVGLRFPEGPIAMPDGSILLVEIERGTLTRVLPDGRHEIVARPGGGPNGAAIGPDGKCYVCNNGGFSWVDKNGLLRPTLQPEDYSGGRIERIDLASGKVEILYTHFDGLPLRGPNDLVFDGHGGFYFTDRGKVRMRDEDRTGIYYAKADGSSIREIAFPMISPNGIALSPDDSVLYVAETMTGRVWAFDLLGPGEIDRRPWPSPHGGRLLAGVGGFQLFDSMAVDGAGNVCVATLINGGITVISPDGAKVEHIPFPDSYVTNICFGGEGLRTAFITLSTTGRLIAVEWPRPGLGLHYLNRR
ncbi:MAG: SMP-30/gluconolactonase/LRE family protein [Alphaproteobacteria bacterium]|nr:SMP-30/gluconolactonase/LRE family protein [Alphaproteobacteria bacterium]